MSWQVWVPWYNSKGGADFAPVDVLHGMNEQAALELACQRYRHPAISPWRAPS